MNKLSNYTKRLEDFQNTLIANKNDSTVFGDGKKLVNNDVFKIENNFSDQLYMRKLTMPKDCVIVSAIHHTEHFWFLMKGKLKIANEDGVVTYSAPTYVNAKSGAKRVIIALEDSVFVNIHPNPDNIRDIEELERILSTNNPDESSYYSVSWRIAAAFSVIATSGEFHLF